MAKRRMFSTDIICQDKFLDMPSESQVLYFHLGMNADDEGFVSPKRVMRMINVGDDSLKLLVAKNYVIPFESGVVVITHWKQNNYIQRDRFSPSVYQKELDSIECIRNVYKMDTQGGREVGRKEQDTSLKRIDSIKEEISKIVGKKKI